MRYTAGAVVLLHGLEHLVGDLFRHLRPDFNDFVVALGVGDRAFLILLLNFDHLPFGVFDQLGLVPRNDHVVDTDGNAGTRRIEEAEFLDFVEHLHSGLQPELQVAILNELSETLLLQQTVDEWHLLRHNVVEDDAPHSGVHVLLVEFDRLGMEYVLVIERLGQVDELPV